MFMAVWPVCLYFHTVDGTGSFGSVTSTSAGMIQVFISNTHLDNNSYSGGQDMSDYPAIRRSETSENGIDRDPLLIVPRTSNVVLLPGL